MKGKDNKLKKFPEWKTQNIWHNGASRKNRKSGEIKNLHEGVKVKQDIHNNQYIRNIKSQAVKKTITEQKPD